MFAYVPDFFWSQHGLFFSGPYPIISSNFMKMRICYTYIYQGLCISFKTFYHMMALEKEFSAWLSQGMNKLEQLQEAWDTAPTVLE